MNFDLRHATLTLRAALLGFLSGILSCLLVESRIIYVAREQKTFDHVVWPGLVFAIAVLFPVSRWAGCGRWRIVAALISSSMVYPVAWRIATLTTPRLPASWGLTIAAFALAGLVGSLVLAIVLLFGRAGWARAVTATVMLGAIAGGLMGANLAAATSIAHWPFAARDGLGSSMILWQAVVGASLGHGLQSRLGRAVEAAGPGAAHGTPGN